MEAGKEVTTMHHVGIWKCPSSDMGYPPKQTCWNKACDFNETVIPSRSDYGKDICHDEAKKPCSEIDMEQLPDVESSQAEKTLPLSIETCAIIILWGWR